MKAILTILPFSLILTLSFGCVHTRKQIVEDPKGHRQTIRDEDFVTLQATRFYGQSMYLLACTEAHHSHGVKNAYYQCLEKAKKRTRENFDEILNQTINELPKK